MTAAFTGTGTLLRLAVRRDRIQVPVWLCALTAVVAGTAASIIDLYATEQLRLDYVATTVSSPVALAFNGPTSGPSLGAIVVVETTGLVGLLLAMMTTFLVVRHTRQNEENGRAELVGAAVVGRYAQLTAAVTLAVLVNAVFGALISGVLLSFGLPFAGALLTGAGLALTGMAFAGVAAVTAQLTESARAANGLAVAAVGLSFLARAAGDAFGTVSRDAMSVASAWSSWVSPLGWAQQVRPFAGNHGALLLLPVAFTVGSLAVAFVLSGHRDLGAGMMPARRGAARASAGLAGPLGLAWRLQRGALLGWAAGFAVLGVSFGAIADQVAGMVEGNPAMAEVMTRLGGSADLVAGYLSAILGLFAVAISGYVVQALLRLRAEESAGLTEAVLATAVSRVRWMTSHVAVALLGGTALLVVAGLSTAAGYRLTVGAGPLDVADLLGAALVRLPAVAVVGALVTAVFGLLPRFVAPVGWAVLAACVLIAQLGAVLELPQPVLDLSPFTHVPGAPAAQVTTGPLWWLSVTAVGVTVLGFAAFRRRDITT